MTRISDRQVPPWLEAELARRVANLPTAAVLALARADQSIARGFRLKPASAPILRQRLQTLLDNGAESTSAIVDALREHDLNAAVLGVLSERVIERQFDSLAGYFGTERWLLAILLDKRLRIRQLAEPWLAEPHKREALPDREQCRRALSDNLAPFMKFVAELSVDNPTADDSDSPASAPCNATDSAQLQQLEVRLRKQTRLREKLQQLLDDAQNATAAAKKTSASLRERLQHERDAQAQTEARLQQLENDFDAQLAAQLQAASSHLSRHWLQAPSALQRAVDTPGDDILGQIEQALTRQIELDRHYGNRIQLQREVDSLREALARLDAAVLNSLKPNRELLPLRRRAMARLDELLALLDAEPAPSDATLSRLEMAVRTAPSRESLDELILLLEQLQRFDALDSSQADRIRAARTTRMEVIFEQSEPDNHAKLPADISARREIAASDSARVLIDAHNCLLAVAGITDRFQDRQQAAGAIGRRWLAEACARIFDGISNARAMLFFDGDDSREHSVSGNVIAIYSGGSGEQRADDAIVGHLQYLARDNADHQAFLISNDGALRQRASALGAHIIDGEVLANWCNLYR